MSNFCKRTTALVLFFGLLLQSCHNPNNLPQPVVDPTITPMRLGLSQEGPHLVEEKVPSASRRVPMEEETLLNSQELPIQRGPSPVSGSILQAEPSQASGVKASTPSSSCLIQKQQALPRIQATKKQDKNALEKEIALPNKLFKTKEGKEVSFYQEGGKWKARVKEQVGPFSRSLLLPVYFENPKVLISLHPSEIHIIWPEKKANNSQGCVYLGTWGLPGGGGTFSCCKRNAKTVTEQTRLLDSQQETPSHTHYLQQTRDQEKLSSSHQPTKPERKERYDNVVELQEEEEEFDNEKELKEKKADTHSSSGYVNQNEESPTSNSININIYPSVFKVANTSYEIVPSISVEMAQIVQQQTGLVIVFEPGKSSTEYIGGRGAFGELRLGKDQASGKFYGIKILKPSKGELEEARKEGQLQKKLSSLPHLMPIVDMGEAQNEQGNTILYQVMPLASLGNGKQLTNYLKDIKDPAFKEALLVHLAKSILEGFIGMHRLSEPVVHLDFKPDNLVIDSQGEVYIIDFGCSKYASYNGHIAGDANGDISYFSPERDQVRGDKQNTFNGKAADSWAIGLTLLELSMGMLEDEAKYTLQERRVDYSQYPLLNNPQPGSYGAIVKSFLSRNPVSRLTPEQALAMPLFQQETKPEILVFLKEFVQSIQWSKKKEKMGQQAQGLTSAQQLPLPHFAGYASRPELEQAVIDKLVNGNFPLVACVGMGGVGKTQLLTYLVHQQVLQQRFKKLYWFQAADNETSLLQQYQGLAIELKLPGIDEKTPFAEARAALITYVEKQKETSLLVYDNADNPGLLQSFLPKGNCQVLVSSRSPQWENKVSVEVFTAEQVHELLRRLLSERRTNLEEAKILGEAMGYLPLALNQSIAWMRQEGVSIQEYIQTYQSKQQEILKSNKQLYGKDLPNSMITLYQLQLQKLEKETPEAIQLLEYTSLLAPDNIPLSLLSKGLLEEKTSAEVYQRAIQTLLDYALWQEDKEGNIRMHRLMQEVVKLSLQVEKFKEEFMKLADRIETEYSKRTTVLDEEIRQKTLVPHLEALGQVGKQQLLTNTIQFANLLNCIGRYYQFQQGGYEKAVSLYEEVLKINIEYYGEDHLKIGPILANLGNAYGSLGNYGKQKELLEKALKINIKHYGEDSPTTGVTLASLGNAYGTLGNYEKQKELSEKALKIIIKYYGEDHPETGRVLTNLGVAYGRLGNYEKQKELLEKVLKINIKHYGEDHPETGNTLMNLGNAYGTLGNYEKQKELLEKALKILIKHYGEDHPQTGITLFNLGIAYSALGDYGKCKELLERVLVINIKHYGEDHPETGNTLTALGLSYLKLGNYEKCKELLEKALTINIKHHGEDHLNTGSTLENLSDAYGLLGNYEKQKELLEKALPIFIKHYSEDHPNTVKILRNLDIAYGKLGNYAKKKEILEKTLVIRIKHYGEDHIETGKTLESLGFAYGKLGNYEKQKELLEKALAIAVKHYGENHPEVGRILVDLSDVYGSLYDYIKQKEVLEKALPIFMEPYKLLRTSHLELQVGIVFWKLGNVYYSLGVYRNAHYNDAKGSLEIALTIFMKYYGEDHLNTGSTLISLGNVYNSLGNYEKAKEVLEKALVIKIKLHGEDHIETARTLDNLGNAYGSLGQYEKKKEVLEKALKIKIAHYGEDHLNIGNTLENLSDAYGSLYDYIKQKEVLEKALKINIKYYGENDPSTAVTLTKLGNVYGDLGNYERGKELLEKALKININHYGEDHPQTGITLTNLGNAYGSLGQYEREKEVLEKALKNTIKHYGEDHPETASTLMSLGNAYGHLGNYEKKKEFLEKALAIDIKHYGEDHTSTGITLANLGKAYESLKNKEQALAYYQKAYAIFTAHKHPTARTVKAWMDKLAAQ